MDLLYINAYGVTRCYGGAEEGGWWYNHRHPLASIPVPAKRADGCEHCSQCDEARNGNGEYCVVEEDNLADELCDPKTGIVQHLAPVDLDKVRELGIHLENCFSDIEHGDIYSVLGGEQLLIITEQHPAHNDPRPRYE
jgi:hypothetical protein